MFPLKEAQGVQGDITWLYVSCLGSVSIFLLVCNFPPTVVQRINIKSFREKAWCLSIQTNVMNNWSVNSAVHLNVKF